MAGLISAVVGDDHPIVREGLVRTLNGSGQVTVLAEAGDGVGMLEAIRAHRPQVALTDFRMPLLDGAQVAAVVHREQLPTRVVVLSAYTEPSMLYTALQQGAAGYLSKEADRAEILQAIRDVAAGREVLPANLTGGLLGEIRARRDDGQPTLSGRERDVLTGIAAGKSIPQMANEMYLARSTIKTHIQRLYTKLEVSDRGAVVAEAMRRRLLE